jgi:RPA family protein
MENKRITTVKTKIKPINTGKFVPGEGFNPSYVITNNGMKLSRVRILATVVDKFLAESGKFASVTIDDSSDTIRAKVFNAVSMFDKVSQGDSVDMIARIKEFQGEVYLVPEVITKVDDPNFESLRELEIRKQSKEADKKREIVLEYQKQVSDLEELMRILKERFDMERDEVEAIIHSTQTEEVKDVATDKNKVLSLIESLDTGPGCDYGELITASGMTEDVLDSIINELLTDGVCFEPKPGKIKKL